MRVYRSTDTNAPVLNGTGGSLVALLDAVLVNGYGSAFASGVLTSDAVNVSDNDTVTVGTRTYTFKTTLVAGVANQVLIGGSAAASLTNLAAAINTIGTAGTTYTTATPGNQEVWASATTATTITLTARRGGTTGNSLALSEASTHLTVSGATLTGGSGTDTIPGAGWTRPFTSGIGHACWRQGGSANQLYFSVDDAAQSTTARDALSSAWETFTGFAANGSPAATGGFPAPGVFTCFRKSSTVDTTARPWIICADSRTFYAFVQTGDSVGQWTGPFYFGDFYSLIPGDPWKALHWASAHTATASPAVTNLTNWRNVFYSAMSAGPQRDGKWMPRNFAGFGNPRQVCLSSVVALAGAGPGVFYGVPNANPAWMMTTPNPTDGATYLGWIRLHDYTSFGISGTLDYRGRLRGLYDCFVQGTVVSDGDTFAGGGPLTGKTFQVLKATNSSSVTALMAIETSDTWDTST